jgi:site-specific DNA-methyltransferase (adenine-specific)
MAQFELVEGDCLTVLRGRAAANFDSMVTDPPSGIGFLGEAWDKNRGGRDNWIGWLTEILTEARRTLKPGSHALVWALPRTSGWTHRAVEDAGFEIRDVITHHFAQGFPKSKNVGNGRGTALKPASEHWILARAPFPGTVGANVASYGTGALNIDACRIATDWNEPDRPESWKASGHTAKPDADKIAAPPGAGIECHPLGRWPPNAIFSHTEECRLVGTKRVRGSGAGGVVNATAAGYEPNSLGKESRAAGTPFTRHVDPDGLETVDAWKCADGCPVAELDRQSGVLESHGGPVRADHAPIGYGSSAQGSAREVRKDIGGASRFFYCAKASARERVENIGENPHTTIKPVGLMRWLVKLVTPPGGLVLDPFAGSGTTGVAALMEGCKFVGIEADAAFAKVARERVRNALGPLFAGALEGSDG